MFWYIDTIWNELKSRLGRTCNTNQMPLHINKKYEKWNQNAVKATKQKQKTVWIGQENKNEKPSIDLKLNYLSCGWLRINNLWLNNKRVTKHKSNVFQPSVSLIWLIDICEQWCNGAFHSLLHSCTQPHILGRSI